MTITAFESLACPLDGQPLIKTGNCWKCTSGHSFDVARQGYVHLLPVQKKRSKDPGDSKEMVAARQRFLNAGHYRPIADAVSACVMDQFSGDTLNCLDAGCGEGYYLRVLAESIAPEQELAVLGLDISKWAVQAAARQDRSFGYVVGSNANLPVQPESVDWLMCMFGFPVYTEFARVLRKGGKLIQVDAGSDHLKELREIIYPELKAPRQHEERAPEGFCTVQTNLVRYELSLDNKEAISYLLAMTPHLYRANAEGRARAAALASLKTTVDVTIRVYEKL